MNILLTSAGRRTYMVDYFKKAVGEDGKVYAANSQMSPALHEADGMIISPIIFSDEYIPFLLDTCKTLHIDLIVSFFDIDMPVLSAHREEFEAIGTKLAMSDSSFYEICSDKYVMGQELKAAGLPAAAGYVDLDEVRLHFPLIVKPRFGMGSIGVYKVYDETELQGAYRMCEREVKHSYLKYESANVPADSSVLIQECLDGTEYGLDVICDFDGNYVNTIVRRKYAMRSGETDEAIVLGAEDKGYSELTYLGERFAKHFRPKGLTDIDVIMGEDLSPKIIDINGRFGGGYPFSHIAGADVPRAYVLWMQGRNTEAAECCHAKAGVHGYKDIAPKIYGMTDKTGSKADKVYDKTGETGVDTDMICSDPDIVNDDTDKACSMMNKGISESNRALQDDALDEVNGGLFGPIVSVFANKSSSSQVSSGKSKSVGKSDSDNSTFVNNTLRG